MATTITPDLTNAWLAELEAVDVRLAPHFGRSEVRRRASAYLRGLLSGAERKNGWQLAEVAGDTAPHGIQHLVGRAVWDADAVRDELRAYVVEHLGEQDAVLVIDETGFLKKGTKSVGVKRQYSGTAGRIENSQVGVFLAYTTNRGRAFIDRALYLPAEWAEDGPRRAEAGVPEAVTFATKPALAMAMLERAFAAGITPAWVVADSVYGDHWALRRMLETGSHPFVLTVSGKTYLWRDGRQHRVSDLLTDLHADAETAWQRFSVGDGAKGPREDDWVRLPLHAPEQAGSVRWLLVRRTGEARDDLTGYLAFAPSATPLQELARVAGSRWQVEIGFEEAKGEVGLDQYEVRRWDGWYRHITLALVAHAMLATMRIMGQDAERIKGGMTPRPDSLAAFKRQRGLSSR